MKKTFSIEEKELTCILINAITAKMIFTYPRKIVLGSGNAAWMTVIFVSLIAYAAVSILINMYRKTEMKSIMQLCGEAGGKGFKIAVCVLLSAVLLYNSSLTMRTLPESVKTVLLPLTPMRIILILFGAAAAFGAYMGIFSIARIHSLFLPAAGIILAVFFILLFHNADLSNLYPLFGKGTYNIFIGGISSVSIFSDIILIFIIMPFCKNFSRVKKSTLKAVIISSVISVLIMLTYNLTYPYPASEEFMLPVFQMTRLIKIGDFFQRLEAFFEFVWTISIFLYSALYLFAVSYIWKEAFDLKYYKPLILPFALISIALSFMPSSSVTMLYHQNLASLITIPTAFLLPAVIVLIYNLKKSKENK